MSPSSNSVLCLRRLHWSPAVLALDPHPVHGQLFPPVHLEASVDEVLHFHKTSLCEQVMKLV